MTRRIEEIPLGVISLLSEKPRHVEIWPGDVGHQSTIYPCYRISGSNVLAPRLALQYTLTGRGRLRHGLTTHELTPGTLMLVNFPADFAYDTPPGESWEFLYLSLIGTEARRLGKQIEALLGPVLQLPESDAAVQLFLQLVSDPLDGRRSAPWELSCQAYRLVMLLLRLGLNSSSRSNCPEEPMARAVQYIQKHLKDQLNIGVLARYVNLSRYHFSRLFKLHTGFPPGEYIVRERLQQAMELLQTTQLTAREISFNCGFLDPVHFGKLFRRRIGLTPLDYRRNNRNIFQQ